MSAHGIVRKVSLVARSLRAKWPLRAAQSVGSGARVFGVPWVENRGTIEIGDDFTFSSDPVTSHLVVGRGAVVTIGNRVSIGHGAAIAADDRIEIEDDVTIAPMVMIMDTDFHDVTSMDVASRTLPVRIEAGARIGQGAVLLKGSHLGKDAVVAPGAVVSGTVPAGLHVGGVPAREIRTRAGAKGGAPLDRVEAADRVTRIIAETFQVPRAVTLEDGPATLPGWDSLGVLRLLVTLEDELGVTVDAERLAGARTVSDVVAILL